MEEIKVTSRQQKEVIDLTQIVRERVQKSGVEEGICHLFVMHTTCCITTADLDPGTDHDMLDAIEEIVPHLPYRHPHNPAHAPDHIASSIVGPSVSIPIHQGQLYLGEWQNIVLIEFDGPKERTIVMKCQ